MSGQHSSEWYAKTALGRIKVPLETDKRRGVDLQRISHIFESSWLIKDTYHNDPGFGSYYIDSTNKIAGLNFACPGCGQVTTIDFNKWQWDGNEDKPTVRPSILHKGKCDWHGFLTAGRFHV